MLLGILVLGYRFLNLVPEPVSNGDTVWKVTLSAQFINQKDAVITVPKPNAGRYYKSVSQRFTHPGFSILSPKNQPKGIIRARAVKAGRGSFTSEYHFQLSPEPVRIAARSSRLSPGLRLKYLHQTAEVQRILPALSEINTALLQGVEKKREVASRIFDYVLQIPKDTTQRFDDEVYVVQEHRATTLGRARLFIALLRQQNIPARLVTGFVLDAASQTSPYYWVELYDEQRYWLDYDPEKGFDSKLPGNYVGFTYDSHHIFKAKNSILVSERFSVVEDMDMLAHTRDGTQHGLNNILDLQRLDTDIQSALGYLLVLPLCVLLTVFMRNIIGILPYGVFSVTLLGLAMVSAEMGITFAVAAMVVIVALLVRVILPDTLKRSPRLAIIFIFIILSTVLSVSVMDYFSLSPPGFMVLLPTIILAILVDLFYSYMARTNAEAALIRLFNTIFIAALCIPILGNEILRHVVLKFPELHFFTLALVLLFASYKGKMLSDYGVLKVLGKNNNRKKRNKNRK
ncbi:MAG: transglutaminase domain-containing protein, partial [Gammaproteobacteria bacterium]|nr:transglutaminase domain-containing protein [Gammaproteobacteria bacterium]